MFDKNVVVPILAAGAICKILLDNCGNSASGENTDIDYETKYNQCIDAQKKQSEPFTKMGDAFGSIGNIASNYFYSKLPKSATSYAYLMFAIFILVVILFILISYTYDIDKTTSMAVLVILPIVFFGFLTAFVLQKQNSADGNDQGFDSLVSQPNTQDQFDTIPN
jgi:uncharacterized membrane protein (DUF485 family)